MNLIEIAILALVYVFLYALLGANQTPPPPRSPAKAP